MTVTNTGVVQTPEVITRTRLTETDLTGLKYTFVQPDGTALNTVKAATASASGLSILLDEAVGTSAAPKPVAVAIGGGAKLKLGGSVKEGDFLTATTAGVGIATVVDKEFYGARAEEDGASGDIISVTVMNGKISA